MNQTATWTFTVGILFVRQVRDFLAQEKFKGRQIDFLESSGWLERDFVVKGEVEAVRYVQRCVEAWARETTAASKAKP